MYEGERISRPFSYWPISRFVWYLYTYVLAGHSVIGLFLWYLYTYTTYISSNNFINIDRRNSRANLNTQQHTNLFHGTCTMYRIKEKVSLSVVMERVVHDIVSCDVHGEYAICLGCNKPIQWIKSKYLKGYLDLDLLIKKQALDAGITVSPVIICHDDNVNINLYNKFCELYMKDTRNKKSPSWDGHWF